MSNRPLTDLKTIPGVGRILALTLLYEIHDIDRFARVGDFLSYARLVKSQTSSAGRVTGTSGAKIGNAHLKWAIHEAAVLMLRHADVGAVEQIEEGLQALNDGDSVSATFSYEVDDGFGGRNCAVLIAAKGTGGEG